MKELDSKVVLDVARQAASMGREVLLNYFGDLSQVSEKKLAGLVSEADLESERVITEFLIKKFPDIPVLGEEAHFMSLNSADPREPTYASEGDQHPYRWVIDPLDGTTNYVHQFPIFCISIGFEYLGDTVVGVIDVPKLDNCYYACKGLGAFMDGERLAVSDRSGLREALVATGFSASDRKSLKEQIRIFSKVISQVRGVRRAGAAAFDLCMVAHGVFDAFWEKNLSPWDTSAGALLVREAGGVVSSYDGTHFKSEMKSILAASPKTHTQLLSLLEPILNPEGLSKI